MYKSFQSVLVSVDMSDLMFLIKSALKHEEITISRAAELLGMSTDDVRALTDKWCVEDDSAKIVDDCGWVDLYDDFEMTKDEHDEFTDKYDFEFTDPYEDFGVDDTCQHPCNTPILNKLRTYKVENSLNVPFHDNNCKPDQLGSCRCSSKKCHGVTTNESILYPENDDYPAEGGGCDPGLDTEYFDAEWLKKNGFALKAISKFEEDDEKIKNGEPLDNHKCCSDCEDCEWFHDHFGKNK